MSDSKTLEKDNHKLRAALDEAVADIQMLLRELQVADVEIKQLRSKLNEQDDSDNARVSDFSIHATPEEVTRSLFSDNDRQTHRTNQISNIQNRLHDRYGPIISSFG